MDQGRLFRSNDARIAGVCGGIAQRLHIDCFVARLCAVCFCFLSCGALFLAYAFLWLVLPKEPIESRPLEVKPQEVVSDTYGPLSNNGLKRDKQFVSLSHPIQSLSDNRRARGEMRYSYQAGIAHVPPVPPKGRNAAKDEKK